MASLARRVRRPLREELADYRQKNPRRERAKATPKQVGRSQFSKCGPNGELREHPTIYGLRWLSFFGEALRLHGACFDWKVSASGWQRDGTVELRLQRRIHSPLPGVIPDQGGVWESWRIPVGAVNNHDTRAVLRKVMEPKAADLVIASSPHLRAINGL